MKKNEKRPQAPISDSELVRIAQEGLRSGGNLFPRTADDLSVLESELDGVEGAEPDVDLLVKMIMGSTEPISPRLPVHSPSPVPSISEDLALAARKGSQITPEARAKMDADRRAAEGTRIEQ